METKRMKRMIYRHTIAALLAVYLIFMLCFSIFFLIWQEKLINYEMGSSSSYVNSTVQLSVQRYVDENNQLIDAEGAKIALVQSSPFFERIQAEVAIYSHDQDLLYHTSGGWLCGYTGRKEVESSSSGYAILHPSAWLSKKEIGEIIEFLHCQPTGKNIGDLDGYQLQLEGFWLDNELIIPEKIMVYARYISDVSEQVNMYYIETQKVKEYILTPPEEKTNTLPYFSDGQILLPKVSEANREALQQGILQHKELLLQLPSEAKLTYTEKTSLLTKRVYAILPYQNFIYQRVEGNEIVPYSPVWTIVAWESNPLKEGGKTLLFVWLGCFIVFAGVTGILAESTYRTEKKREALEKHRIETANALAHDLKTPLSIISGYAQSLAENVQTEKREYYAGNILKNISRMDNTIQEMLELSRLDPEVFTPQFQDISLKEISARVIERYKELCEEKEIQTRLTGDAVIHADGLLIERVIDHFFVNAMNHIQQEGEAITIEISASKLSFYNSGSHIPEEEISEIWQTNKKTTVACGKQRNGGFGLSISRTILELHKFAYGAKNEEDGVTFWFTFGNDHSM